MELEIGIPSYHTSPIILNKFFLKFLTKKYSQLHGIHTMQAMLEFRNRPYNSKAIVIILRTPRYNFIDYKIEKYFFFSDDSSYKELNIVLTCMVKRGHLHRASDMTRRCQFYIIHYQLCLRLGNFRGAGQHVVVSSMPPLLPRYKVTGCALKTVTIITGYPLHRGS